MEIVACFCDDMTVTACWRMTNVSRQSLTNYYDNVRGLFSDEIRDYPVQLLSPGPYEVDEFRIEHVKTGDNCYKDVWIQDILERSTGRYLAFVLDNRSSAILIPNIQGCIPPNSLVFTDDWASYHPLSREGYRHYSVNHSSGEMSRTEEIDRHQVDIHINTLEGIHRVVRQRLMNKSRRNLERLELILAEFTYRRAGRPLIEPLKIRSE